jgi:2'-hydroxyisoflavone reductase
LKLLVLGGTGFLGRHVVETALERGHQATTFARGKTLGDLPAGVERLVGDRDGDLGALAGGSWDAAIDLSGYTGEAIRATGAALADPVAHVTFVSSVSAYADLRSPGVTEDAPLLGPGSEPGYGASKADAERALLETASWPVLIVRPGIITGPGDATERVGYWLDRVAAGSRIIAPAPPERPVQLADARDLARWILELAEAGATGVFNATPAPSTFHEFLDGCRSATGGDASAVWVDERDLVAAGLAPWRDLPLWSGPELAGYHAVDSTRAAKKGLCFRPLADTVADVVAWRAAEGGSWARRGLTRQREAELLGLIGSRAAGRA